MIGVFMRTLYPIRQLKHERRPNLKRRDEWSKGTILFRSSKGEVLCCSKICENPNIGFQIGV
jgi:hypothetical protein